MSDAIKCKRPRCSEVFVPRRRDQVFCCTCCQQAFNKSIANKQKQNAEWWREYRKKRRAGPHMGKRANA